MCSLMDAKSIGFRMRVMILASSRLSIFTFGHGKFYFGSKPVFSATEKALETCRQDMRETAFSRLVALTCSFDIHPRERDRCA